MTTDDESPDAALICWIGDTDLLAFGQYGITRNVPAYFGIAEKVWMLDKAGSDQAGAFRKAATELDLKTRSSSIVLTLQKSGQGDIPRFSHLLLFTNRPSGDPKLAQEFCDRFASFLCAQCPQCALEDRIVVRFVPQSGRSDNGVNAWDYRSVYNATKEVLRAQTDEFRTARHFYNITPGTIAQSTMLILLGKEDPSESHFIQVEKGRQRVEVCDIPFDINAVIDRQAAHVEERESSSLIGKAAAFKRALARAEIVAPRKVTLLLTGESGTGKEVLARWIHERSGRRGQFVAVNCAQLNPSTGITDLTGYYKGAYTDATEDTPGYFAQARDGTLFLDEIGECPPEVQATLLRFLQPLDHARPAQRSWTMKGTPVRGSKYKGEQTGEIVVIAATNRDLQDPALRFRQDLFYRLEAIQIRLPSLEERKHEDLHDLAEFFLGQDNTAFQLSKVLTPEAHAVLLDHVWHGNIRELQNVITRAVLFSAQDAITAHDIASNFNPHTSQGVEAELEHIVRTTAEHDVKTGFKGRLKQLRALYCRAVKDALGGTTKKAAYEFLGMSPKTFNGMLGEETP